MQMHDTIFLSIIVKYFILYIFSNIKHLKNYLYIKNKFGIEYVALRAQRIIIIPHINQPTKSNKVKHKVIDEKDTFRFVYLLVLFYALYLLVLCL